MHTSSRGEYDPSNRYSISISFFNGNFVANFYCDGNAYFDIYT